MHTATHRLSPSVLALGLLAAIGAAVAGGCGFNFDRTVRETRVVETAHVPGSSVVVRTANGAVNVSKSEGEAVVVTAEVRALTDERLAMTTVVAARADDGSLRISVEWPEGKRRSNEGCRFDVEIPDAIGVDIETGNGGITISGLAGEAKLTTSNGAILARGHAGHVNARTSNGRITVEGCAGDATAQTSNGRVEMRAVGGAVDVRTSNGRVVVEQAPDGGGPVRIRTSNGRIVATLGARFSGPLAIDTSNGSIDVGGIEGATLNSLSKRSVRLQIGEGGEESTISTSNGAVVVRRQG